MAPENRGLHMLNLNLDGQGLVRLGHRRGLSNRAVDTGYLVHCLLRELFGDLAPAPFVVRPQEGRGFPVLGYGAASADRLRDVAQATATPDLWNACDWAGLASKPMPQTWNPGAEYGFSTRVCPVVRMAKVGVHNRRGAEVDAFLRRCWQIGDGVPVSRGEVYVDWLREQFERHGGATVVEAGLSGFQRARLVRRGHKPGRVSHVAERPDATLAGRLRITDPVAFAALLARGLGRHRGFGFGMLLLRRPN